MSFPRDVQEKKSSNSWAHPLPLPQPRNCASVEHTMPISLNHNRNLKLLVHDGGSTDKARQGKAKHSSKREHDTATHIAVPLRRLPPKKKKKVNRRVKPKPKKTLPPTFFSNLVLAR